MTASRGKKLERVREIEESRVSQGQCKKQKTWSEWGEKPVLFAIRNKEKVKCKREREKTR